MNSRLCLSLFIIPLVFLAACAKKEKATVDLHVDEKVIEVKQDEVSIVDGERKSIVTAVQSSQLPPQKMSDNSEITVMYDGYGNKLEKRYFKGHSRLDSVVIRTSVNGRREILVYGQNGEKTSIDGELSNRLLTASADEIANAAKLYENRSIYRTRKMPVAEQPKPQPEIPSSVTLPPQPEPVAPEQNQTTTEEPVQETPENKDSTENPPSKEPKEGKDNDERGTLNDERKKVLSFKF